MTSPDVKTKLLLLGIICLSLIAGYFSYQHFVVKRDFEIFYSEDIENLEA